ncbi:phage tail length tape measure family protein [Desulfosoma sp.]
MSLVEIIRRLEGESLDAEALQAVLLQALREIEPLQNVATRAEFRQLAAALETLAEAQARTEKRLEELIRAEERTEERLEKVAVRVEELTEAQKRTEQRLTELSEAQKRTEERLEKLAARVEELTEAQKHTEQRLGELSEAQKRTEERLEKLAARMEELSEAQKRTEESLLKLTHRLEVVEDRLEGISNSVGYSLENEAFKALPFLLQERHGIAVQGRLVRRYVGDRQVNIFGRARHDGHEVVVIGECKVRPSRKEVDRFLKITQRLAEQLGWEHMIRLFVAHDFPPTVEEHLRDRDVLVFWSYEF